MNIKIVYGWGDSEIPRIVKDTFCELFDAVKEVSPKEYLDPRKCQYLIINNKFFPLHIEEDSHPANPQDVYNAEQVDAIIEAIQDLNQCV